MRLRNERKIWDVAAREDIDFYLGNHYTREEIAQLEARNQSPIPLDRIFPGIELLKSILSARPPQFIVKPREDSDSKLANVWQTVLSYIWDISDGNSKSKDVIHDYATTGLGYFYAYEAPDEDYGRGEIMITSVSPFRVYVSSDTRDRLQEEASTKILSTVISGEQVTSLYPELLIEHDGRPLIDSIDPFNDSDYPATEKQDTMQVITPDVADTMDYSATMYQILERFYPVRVPFYRVVDLETNKDIILSDDEFEVFVKKNEPLFTAERLKAVQVFQRRIKVTASIGQVFLYERVLNTSTYPLVPFVNIWTGTHLPKSDVSKVRALQLTLDKISMLVLAHAAASGGLKLLVPVGSIDDVAQLEMDWANPTAVIEFNAGMGEPHYPAPAPLASEFYNFIQRIEFYIDFILGVPELLHGIADKAPETFRGTMALADFASGRPKSKLQDFEASVRLLGRTVYNMAKGHYTYQKTFRVVQPNNDLNEATVNFYDDKSGAIAEMQNDLRSGFYDVGITTGSMMPTQRERELAMHVEMFDRGIIDQIEVLKKTDIYDKAGVLERASQMAQLANQNEQLEKALKEAEGLLQSSRREIMHSKEKVELTSFKADLEVLMARAKYMTEAELAELTKSVQLVAKEFELEMKHRVKSSD